MVMMRALSTILVFALTAISVTAVAQPSVGTDSWMCVPGEVIFAEDFDPETVSERWGFKEHEYKASPNLRRLEAAARAGTVSQ